MFTGIVQGRGVVIELRDHPGGRCLDVRLPPEARGSLQIGGSISIAGVCLTIVEHNEERVKFDIIAESLRLTNLGSLRVGDHINVERAARFGDEIGGHLLSGHVSGTAELVERVQSPEEVMLKLRLTESHTPYVFAKGFIAIDGVSLTVGRVEDSCFTVHLIPETLRRTTLTDTQLGQRLNIELDAMTQAVVETVERVMKNRD